VLTAAALDVAELKSVKKVSFKIGTGQLVELNNSLDPATTVPASCPIHSPEFGIRSHRIGGSNKRLRHL